MSSERLRLWLERDRRGAGYHLRDALGDDAENPRFIETLTQRRYRFLAQVETDAVEPLSPPPTV